MKNTPVTLQVRQEAINLISNSPAGMHYKELFKKIKEGKPDSPGGTIHTGLRKLKTKMPPEIFQPSKGLYKHVKYGILPSESPAVGKSPKVNEIVFYQPFADYLVGELEECTSAKPVGGNILEDKWGTPDVIGVYEAGMGDIIKFQTEITSAEIKTDTNALIIAFGQACAYKLFSHRSYIVIPKNSSDEDIGRLDALAQIFGIGLVLFDNTDEKDPKFEIKVRASRHEPDMFYVNTVMPKVANKLNA